MVSSTPAGSGLPIGLMPGALPSDHCSRQTLNTTAMRLLFGQSQSAFFMDGTPSISGSRHTTAAGAAGIPSPASSESTFRISSWMACRPAPFDAASIRAS